MSALKLVIFDVDGTLVDSQGDILAAMTAAFDTIGHPVPDRKAVLGIVGLSLDVAMTRLAPDVPAPDHAALVEGYKNAYVKLRAASGPAESSPLYPGMRSLLDGLRAESDILLGVATGKSRRGLDKLIEGHGLERYFQTQQVADNHPSKPNPSMILTCLAETGVEPHNAVMIGDTSYDMDMAHAAGVAGIGVTWGYHPQNMLSRASMIVSTAQDLKEAIPTALGGNS